MKITVQDSGLNEWIGVLEGAADDVLPEARKVVGKAALNIKKDAQKKSSGIAHAPNYPRTITYDTAVLGTSVTAEIGPDKNKVVGGGPNRTPGNLGHIFEYGTSRNAPLAHLGPALDYEAPNLERYLGDLGEDLLT